MYGKVIEIILNISERCLAHSHSMQLKSSGSIIYERSASSWKYGLDKLVDQ